MGPAVATNVIVTNAIPIGITTFNWVRPDTGFTIFNSPLNYTIPTMAVGDVVTFFIKLDVPVFYSGNLVMETVISGTNVDPFPICNGCTDTDTVATGADIVVTNTNNQTSIHSWTSVNIHRKG